MPLLRKNGSTFNYDDYVSWPDDERWELIGGIPYCMTPAPTFRHQRIAVRFVVYLENGLAGSPCVASVAPTDVVLSDHDVVQPDVLVVCDPSKITQESVRGAPDLVIEIMSPATALKDRKTKRDLYERFGVKEYVLVDPEGEYVERLVLGEDRIYGKGELLGPDETLVLTSLASLSIPLREVFETPEDNRPAEEASPEEG